MGNNISEQKSIAGLRANAAAFIVNLSFFTGLGLLIPIFALILEDKNSFVRAYSKQTLAISALTFISFLLNFIIFIGNFAFLISEIYKKRRYERTNYKRHHKRFYCKAI